MTGPHEEEPPKLVPMLGRTLDAFARWLLAIPASLAPKRYWLTLEEYLPLGRAHMASAVLSIALGFAVGHEGFFSYGHRANEPVAEAVLEAERGRVTGPEIMVFGTTALLAFVFFTPTGLLAPYLGTSGTARACGVVMETPFGDPVLTLADWAARSRYHKTRSQRARRRREEAKGPEVPDLAVEPAALRMQGCDLVIVASRRKPGWDPGVFVVDGPRTYRLGATVDRHFPTGLRALYPLTLVNSVEALRRWVAYEVPPPTSPQPLLTARPASTAPVPRDRRPTSRSVHQ